jgi:hypothetical protein
MHFGAFVRFRSLSLLLALGLTAPLAAAESAPLGKFQCRHYENGGSGIADPVAYLWLLPNGKYEVLDLTTTQGKTSGHYRYDGSQQLIDWTTGDWAHFVGHYIPHGAGAAAITVNTRKDPLGHVDGTLPCVQVPEKQGR